MKQINNFHNQLMQPIRSKLLKINTLKSDILIIILLTLANWLFTMTEDTNGDLWTRVFMISAAEIVDMSAYKSLLLENRHHEFKEMIIYSMFGRFNCDRCNSKSWTSTTCNTEIKYRYNPNTEQGEIEIVKEFGQACNRCNRRYQPKFDHEAVEMAMSKISERIKKVFYNQGPPSNEHSSRHSHAKDRKVPHDSSRCQACQEGKCSFSEDYDFDSSRRRHVSQTYQQYHGPQKRIPWALRVDGIQKIVHPTT